MFTHVRLLTVKNIKSIYKIVFLLTILLSVPVQSRECVILLHGLARTSDSMQKLQTELSKIQYYVANIDYPSRKHSIVKLAEMAVKAGLDECSTNNASPVNFVTHSLGGILVRQYFSKHRSDRVKRVVMLGPPNKGSEVVDNLKDMPGFDFITGPAGLQLGTGDNSVPVNLGPVNFEFGIIAGTQAIDIILSTYLPDPDDGKISVENTKVDGMCGFVTLPTSHLFMMRNNQAISEVINFLKDGKFKSDSAISNNCKK